MRARLMALAAAILFFISPIQPSLAAATDFSLKESNPIELELPSALSADDSFDDLPFEQLRQALREEVEGNPQKQRPPLTPKTYNWLIR